MKAVLKARIQFNFEFEFFVGINTFSNNTLQRIRFRKLSRSFNFRNAIKLYIKT